MDRWSLRLARPPSSIGLENHVAIDHTNGLGCHIRGEGYCAGDGLIVVVGKGMTIHCWY